MTDWAAESAAHLDWRTFMSASGETPPSTIKALDDYFSHFVALEIKVDADGKRDIATQNCAGCGNVLSGLFGTWQWAMAHGDGMCGKCGWPSRAHHFIKDESGKEVATLRHFILQIHPDYVERKPRVSHE